MAIITENIAVNGSAGAFIALSATQWSRQVIIMEDPVNAPAGVLQGLQYQLQSENFLKTHSLAAGETLTLGNTIAIQGGKGSIVGMPAQTIGGQTISATVLAKVKSLTVTGTAVRVQEMD